MAEQFLKARTAKGAYYQKMEEHWLSQAKSKYIT